MSRPGRAQIQAATDQAVRRSADGHGGYGIDMAVADRLAREIAEAVNAGAEIAVVVGGGNIFRGLRPPPRAWTGHSRLHGHAGHRDERAGHAAGADGTRGGARVMSAIPMPTVCESYVRPQALAHLAQGRVVMFAAGTGNPFFTTDTAATLRAIETCCDAVVKAPGRRRLFSDPKKDPRRFATTGSPTPRFWRGTSR